mmetsp:Transcript_21558/g.56195  ORF Transcript_21558/g.56195 Transcript_21558/m.56195 type:complete len:326 (-) Transcript_21558:588-1565(-)
MAPSPGPGPGRRVCWVAPSGSAGARAVAELVGEKGGVVRDILQRLPRHGSATESLVRHKRHQLVLPLQDDEEVVVSEKDAELAVLHPGVQLAQPVERQLRRVCSKPVVYCCALLGLHRRRSVRSRQVGRGGPDGGDRRRPRLDDQLNELVVPERANGGHRVHVLRVDDPAVVERDRKGVKYLELRGELEPLAALKGHVHVEPVLHCREELDARLHGVLKRCHLPRKPLPLRQQHVGQQRHQLCVFDARLTGIDFDLAPKEQHIADGQQRTRPVAVLADDGHVAESILDDAGKVHLFHWGADYGVLGDRRGRYRTDVRGFRPRLLS